MGSGTRGGALCGQRTDARSGAQTRRQARYCEGDGPLDEPRCYRFNRRIGCDPADSTALAAILQRSRSALSRARNVEGVFAVPPHMAEMVQGKRLLLVDDVMTTGATLSAASQALRDAGAAQISVVVFARVQPSTEF